jgi:hypothetical protein
MHGAAGRVAHNLLANNFVAVSGSGGDGTPQLRLESNTSQHNKPIGSIFTPAWEYATQVDLSPSGAPALTPRVTHPAPVSLDVVELNNAFVHNDCVGTRFLAFSPPTLTPDAATMNTSPTLTAHIGGIGPNEGNLFGDNHCVGVAIDGGNGTAVAGVTYTARMDVTTTHNTFDSNMDGAQVVSVGHFTLPYSGIKTFTAPFQELRHSLLSLTTDAAFDYWNPAHDVYACGELLDDTVLVNGNPVFGTSVDPALLCPADQ